MLMGVGLGDHDEGRLVPNRRRATVASVHEPSRQARASVDGKRFPARQGENGCPSLPKFASHVPRQLVCRPSGKYRLTPLDESEVRHIAARFRTAGIEIHLVDDSRREA